MVYGSFINEGMITNLSADCCPDVAVDPALAIVARFGEVAEEIPTRHSAGG